MHSPSNVTLYTITADFLALEELLEQQSTATDADADVVAKWLEELSGALDSKIDRCIQYVRSQEALATAATEEADRLRARARIHENRVARLKEAIKFVFGIHQIKKVETPHGSVRVQGSGGKQPIEVLGKRPDDLTTEDLALLPEAYTKRVLDNEATRAILDKAEVNEKTKQRATGVASYLPRGSSVVIS